MSNQSCPPDPAIRVCLLPKDTNVHGTIFGGMILSYIDQAGAIAARPYTPARVVTVAMKEVEFHEPVFVGDLVSFYAWATRLGNSSIWTKVSVYAERYDVPGKVVKVTEAEVVYCAVGEDFEKLPVQGILGSPPQAPRVS